MARSSSNFGWLVFAISMFSLPFVAQAQWGQPPQRQFYVAQSQKVTPAKAVYAQSGFNSSVRKPSVPPTTAQVDPPPPPSPAPIVNNIQPPAVNVQPPVVNVAPPVVNVAPPAVTVSPTLSTAPTTWWEEFKTSATPVLLSLITAILAWRGYTKTPIVGGVVATPSIVGPLVDGLPAEASLLLRLRDKIGDPDFKAKIDEALLAAVSTGIPGKLVQGGLSAIPVAGPVVGGFAQPLLEKAFVKFLESRLETNTK
jgi:hypothetical protein